MRHIFRLAIVFILTLGLTGCSNATVLNPDNKTSEGSQSEQPKELILVDSGYALSEGYIRFALKVDNPNNDFMARTAKVTINRSKKDGELIDSSNWTITNIMPESTSYWASITGDGNVEDDEVIKISLSVDPFSWEKSDIELPPNLYTIADVSYAFDRQFNKVVAKGEVTLNESFSTSTASARIPLFVCIVKDANGKIITGFSERATEKLTVDVPTSFEVSNYFCPLEFEEGHIEIYANP